jgi:hypothetical protein
MAAGVSKRLWEMKDIVDMLEAREIAARRKHVAETPEIVETSAISESQK